MAVQHVLLLEDSAPDAELVVEMLAGERPSTVVTTCTTLRSALDLADEGASLHTIAAILNSDGLLNPAGRRWHPSAVARCLAPPTRAGAR